MTNYDFEAMRKRDSEVDDQENMRRIKLREAEWTDVRRRMEAGSDKKVDNHLRPSMEKWQETYPDLLYLKPREIYDKAIVGIVERINLTALCYDTQEILDILQQDGAEHSMSQEESIEHFEYNIRGSYVGEHSPVFLERNV